MQSTGPISPTAPAANTYRPKRPSSMWWSRRIGSKVPSAVVVSPIATGRNAFTSPAASSAPTTAIEITIEMAHETIASRPGRSLSRLGSNS